MILRTSKTRLRSKIKALENRVVENHRRQTLRLACTSAGVFAEWVFEWPRPKLDPKPEWYGKRRWRLDMAIPSLKIAVELHGGIWSRGRHSRPAGLLADMEKSNALQSNGWCVLQFSGEQIDRELAECVRVILVAYYLRTSLEK